MRSVLFFQKQGDSKAPEAKHRVLANLPWNLTLSSQENVERLLLRVNEADFDECVSWEMQVLKGKQLLKGPIDQLACMLDDTASIILLSDATQEKGRSSSQRFGESSKVDYGAEFENLVAQLICQSTDLPKLTFSNIGAIVK